LGLYRPVVPYIYIFKVKFLIVLHFYMLNHWLSCQNFQINNLKKMRHIKLNISIYLRSSLTLESLHNTSHSKWMWQYGIWLFLSSYFVPSRHFQEQRTNVWNQHYQEVTLARKRSCLDNCGSSKGFCRSSRIHENARWTPSQREVGCWPSL
jgi:hypothetical protein